MAVAAISTATFFSAVACFLPIKAFYFFCSSFEGARLRLGRKITLMCAAEATYTTYTTYYF